MSLSSALNVAQSSLSATSLQSSIVSRNVAGASDPNFGRKAGLQITTYGGAVKIASIGRAMDAVLFAGKIAATSAATSQQAIVDGLDQLENTVNDPELNQSLAAKLGALTNALQQYGVTPDDPLLAQEVLTRAHDIATSLNQASAAISEVRKQADADMTESVGHVNSLLAEFETNNADIIKGTKAGRDITDLLDTRERILSQLSEEMGISTSTRGDNDMVIYTDSGVTLFETVPRSVTMAPSFALGPGSVGASVFVDGVPVTGASNGAIMPIKSGKIYGSSVIRDDVAVTYQRQVDEIARGLIEVFAETDQTAVPPAVPTKLAGLFTTGTAAMLPSGVAVNGIAAAIRVNPAADPTQGGNLDRIRDGGLAGAAYVYNTTGEAGFSDRIQGMLDELNAQRNFDPSAKADPSNSLAGFASSSVGWLEAERQTATTTLGYSAALLQRTTESLSNAMGVNIDEEMTLMMELERSYAASSNLISTIDRMLESLLQAVR
ncbi:flagellar hook-associated protein FlgK [Bosea sp. BH3]|uniref:flagellar hook-associated protein FlgK n=1 Tax=Bosea sp. BH3 TaxID=2871701 RepID=UPI0021CB5B18|nr:flagellar hook-associated protein FlgK [Bosea sp. BH3]MCU4179528.1 flagellar hook-associated protein FlgK [Bosea sp. BH3]